MYKKSCAYSVAVQIPVEVGGAAWVAVRDIDVRRTMASVSSYCHRTTGEHKHSSEEQDDNSGSCNNHEHVLDDDKDVAAESQMPTLTGSLKTTSIVVIWCL